MKNFKITFFFIFMILCVSSMIVMAQDEDLMHHYKFDGDLVDEVADSNGVYVGGDGELNFVEGYDGTPSGAINFDGANGKGYMIYMGRWSAVQEWPDTSMTLTFWALWYGSYADNTQDIINKRDNYETPDMVWGVNKPGPGDNLNISVRRRGVFADSEDGMDENVWTHIAVALDGEFAYFYKNGELYQELEYTYGRGFNSRVHMGTAGNSNGSWRQVDAFNGALDDVRFYSRMLTEDEVQQVYEGTTGLDDKSSTVPVLTQNYPNPFSSSTTIMYSLARKTQTEIAVYDLLGHKVATLVHEYQNAGTYKVIWDASRFSAGVYIYQLKTNDFILTEKMKLIK
jgi:hypothetical protein